MIRRGNGQLRETISLINTRQRKRNNALLIKIGLLFFMLSFFYHSSAIVRVTYVDATFEIWTFLAISTIFFILLFFLMYSYF